jgi:organic radical activating enzyme
MFSKKAKPVQLIKSNPNFTKPLPDHEDYIEISEMFSDTIQGEGINTGMPATFLRVQHCTQNCRWCDTTEVWRYGNPYTFEEIFQKMEKANLIEKMKYISGQQEGHHLVLTGGSPLKQQDKLERFLQAFVRRYNMVPYVEIENECTIMPTVELQARIHCWNNSPKLSNSGNIRQLRLQPKILQFLNRLPNSWFKFVITNENDWYEIVDDYIAPGNISKNRIILMPQGATKKELEKNKQKVLKIAIRENVRYSTRMHVDLWDKKTGV